MDSDDDFSAHLAELDVPLSPDSDGMARRTRARASEPKQAAYAWEDEYQRTWDIVKDDTLRPVELLVQQMVDARKAKLSRNAATPFQRGIIRTVVVVVDASRAMLEKDLRPTRFGATVAHLQDFVAEFFDQNPIAQMAVVMMRNGVASVVSELSGLAQLHIERLRALRARQHTLEPKGDPLLQNALELARALLTAGGGPTSRSSREIVVVFGALFTLDPGDIHQTIDSLVRDEIRVRVIGLAAQVAICRELVARTNAGECAGYGVIVGDAHFRELLMACVEPLAVARRAAETATGVPVLRMGFPLRAPAAPGMPVLCACHPQGGGADTGYWCPQCRSRVCLLPCVCPVCGLMLILLTHLARTHHHLVPPPDYEETKEETKETKETNDSNNDNSNDSNNDSCNSNNDSSGNSNERCFGCLAQGDGALGARYACAACGQRFCIDCDVFVHEVLHNCPGCEARAA